MIRLTFLYIFLYLYGIAFSREINTSLLPGRDVCGKQEEQRIYGGEEVAIGEFPWLVLLGKLPASSTSDFFCGGSLINNRYVLTAAHCIEGTEGHTLIVRLGEHNIKTEEDCDDSNPYLEYCSDPPVDIEVEEKTMHENYNSDHYYGDIGLLRLKHEVNYTDFIQPLCLPLSSELIKKAFTGIKVVTVGWGQTEKKLESDVRLKIDLPVTSNNYCAERYLELLEIKIANSQICAGGEKLKSSCYGDSGGPLMYRDSTDESENWICIGVVSMGAKCGGKNVPVVYTRVTSYLEWITDHLEP